MQHKYTLSETIDIAFNQYGATIELLKELLSNGRSIQEFILLACARLDSLSNLAFTEDLQKQKFAKFLYTYSKYKNLFNKVSVTNLYSYVLYHRCALPGTIQKPGRIWAFNPKEDAKLISFIWGSEVAITEPDVGKLLEFVMNVLKRNYRVVPNQSSKRKVSDTTKSVQNLLNAAAKTRKLMVYSEAMNKIGPVIREFTLGALLYKEYRCAAIHEYQVNVDEDDFFKKQRPYWRAMYNEMMYPTRFLKVAFPGPFLLDVLADCVENYKTHLKKTRKLPSDLFFEFYDATSDLQYLDESTIPSGKSLNIRV
jgi:hypothetical protein